MDVYDALLGAIETDYDITEQLKETARSSAAVVRHRKSGTRYVLHRYLGSGTVYHKLLPIRCANLPQIFEVGEKDGHTVVLEEYIQGDTLSYLLSGGLPTEAETLSILRQLCSALWVIHSLGAVHRDVKPENIILRGSEVVLIDFDASRVFQQELESDTQILGTTGYAAPEQYGLSQSDRRADIYSLGILLNILCTGQHPVRTLAPGRLGRVVQKCTMTNPEQRYQTVGQLLEALE